MSNRNLEAMEVIFKYNIDMIGSSYSTLAHEAVAVNNQDGLELILQINPKLASASNDCGMTPFDIAKNINREDLFKKIILKYDSTVIADESDKLSGIEDTTTIFNDTHASSTSNEVEVLTTGNKAIDPTLTD